MHIFTYRFFFIFCRSNISCVLEFKDNSRNYITHIFLIRFKVKHILCMTYGVICCEKLFLIVQLIKNLEIISF